jgi:hypothetical protein
MVQSVGEILKINKAGLDEVDVRHWVERYLLKILGSEVRCSTVDSGKVVLISKSSTIRQELQLIIDELKDEALVRVSYKITDVKIARFGG